MAWHTRGMTALRTLLSAFTETMAPDGRLVRLRFRATLDLLLTAGITILAVALAVGFQVLGRWARRSGWVD